MDARFVETLSVLAELLLTGSLFVFPLSIV